jgi:perosamine synthetase
MKYAIPRYGARHIPGSTKSAMDALRHDRGINGPQIRAFEEQFAHCHGVDHAVTSSYGRMAFYNILRALDFPPGSEVIFPALTFWVVPEIARTCGLRPVFVDIEAGTFNIDPRLIERAVTPRTRAVVPTHLYGQPCDMDPVMEIARKFNLKVIEDCAHSLGATYHGRRTGTLGDAAFFSFQMLKGLNTYGGGMAITQDVHLAGRIRKIAEAEPWPSVSEVMKRIRLGEIQRAMISPPGFSFGLFVGFYLGSFLGGGDLSRFLWETIRPLTPLPASYRRRYSNAQAIIGLQGLEHLDALNSRCRANALQLTRGLRNIPSIATPAYVGHTVPVFYQYCIRSSKPQELSRRAIRRGIDIEVMHVDICNALPLFHEYASHCPVAESTENTLQLPVYARLQPDQIDRIVQVIREEAADLPPLSLTTDRANGRTRSPELRELWEPTTLQAPTGARKSDRGT